MHSLSSIRSILRQQPRPVRFLLATLLMRAGLSRCLSIRRRHYRLRFYPSSYSRTLWLNPGQPNSDEQFFEDYLRPGDTVIDIGANIGTLTLTAARRVGPEGSVLAIEPHPRTFQFLNGNLQLNGITNTRTYQAALGETSGTVRFSSRHGDDQNRVLNTNVAGCDVPIHRLDELLPASEISAESLALLKIDVEGYELHVFRGAEQWLHRAKAIYFELGDQLTAVYNDQPREILEHLRGLGFEIYKISPGQKTFLRLTDEAFPEITNLLALRDVQDFIARTGYREV